MTTLRNKRRTEKRHKYEKRQRYEHGERKFTKQQIKCKTRNDNNLTTERKKRNDIKVEN